MGQVRHCLWPDRNLKIAGPHCLWPDRKHQIHRTSLPMAGPKHQIRRTSLPMAGPVRQTSMRPAGPHCLWPARTPALELIKLANAGRGCSRRKHGCTTPSGSRTLRQFSSPTSIVCQGLVQTGLDLHPMSTSTDGFLHLLLKYLRRRHFTNGFGCALYWIHFTKHFLHGMMICKRLQYLDHKPLPRSHHGVATSKSVFPALSVQMEIGDRN